MNNLVTLERPRKRTAMVKGGLRPIGQRLFIETYGCQMNINDTELMAGVLVDHGYVQVEDAAEADVILVNSCAIREHAERRVIGRLGQLQQYRREHPELIIGVTGCMAQRLGRRLLADVSGLDLVAGPDAYRRLAKVVAEMQTGALERGQVLLELDATENYEGIPSVRRRGVTAWITVQRGCDHRCTFCIVPYVRGPEKNRSPGEILDETRAAVEEGFTELTLLGQTVNSYRWREWKFPHLLQAVAGVTGVRRVRFTSPHPNDVSAELLRVMDEEPAVCRQLHLPVQSGADRVLKRMVRRYDVETYLQTVERVRREVEGIALSTDVIVGFPGETEEEFQATVDLLGAVRFDDAFLYRYSKREGTPASRFRPGDFVADEVARERLERVIGVQRNIQRELNERELGSVQEVLVEREARSEGDLLGRTERNKVVAFPGGVELTGTYVDVRLLRTTGATFVGERAA